MNGVLAGILVVVLLPIALWISLPAMVDAVAWVVGRRARAALPPPATRREHLLVLVPAHDEGLLIERSIRSLLAQDYPEELLTVAVVADNCGDDTAALARNAGALVLERQDTTLRGKGYAIRWALERLEERPWDAVIIIDADTVVRPDFVRELMRWAPLRGKALQTYDTASNEFENWLTRLAGLLTRSRYEVALPLKVSAGLSCPLTGDGLLLGRDVLAAHPWHVQTITEGWEYYARLTLAGIRVEYAPTPVVYAQEAKSLGQSGTQRERWAAGRFAVLGLYAAGIFGRSRASFLQRLDLLAELSSPGPVVRGTCALAGAFISLTLPGPVSGLLVALFATGLAQPLLYAGLALRRHPEPGPTLRAALHLPRYALWRMAVAVRALLRPGSRAWVRTGRTQEH
jgi:1,2-diacylglycerol 3-beta-glucosyltransferase